MLKGMREGVGHKVFKGDKGVGSPEAPIKRQDKNVRNPLVTTSRLGLYFLDALSLRRIGSAARHCGTDVVIFDRFLYDELANLGTQIHTALQMYGQEVREGKFPGAEQSFR